MVVSFFVQSNKIYGLLGTGFRGDPSHYKKNERSRFRPSLGLLDLTPSPPTASALPLGCRSSPALALAACGPPSPPTSRGVVGRSPSGRGQPNISTLGVAKN